MNNRQLAWVVKNEPAIRAMAAMPAPGDLQNRDLVAGHIFKLFMLYAPPVDRAMTDERFKQEAARRKIIAEAFVADLQDFPEWAVAAGIQAFRRTPESRFQPKTPGELVALVTAEVSRAARTLAACARVVEANAMGHNVDTLQRKVGDAQKESDRAGAEMALEVMHLLERICDIYIDPVARELHDKCHAIFHKWRRSNPLPKLPETEKTDV